MKELEVINDPQVIKTAFERTRNQILQILKIREMSIEEISDFLKKDKSTIYRHIKKLEKMGLIHAVKKEKGKKNTITLYGRTAKTFIVSTETFFKSEDLAEMREKKKFETIEILNKMGFLVKDPEKFEKHFYEINRYVFDKIFEYRKDLDSNTFREIYTIISIIYIGNNIHEFLSNFEIKDKKFKYAF